MTQLINFTPRVAAVMQRADEICQPYRPGTIGTEHLLMALAEDKEGIAGQVIDRLGGQGQCLRMLTEILTSEGYHRPSASADQP